MELLVQHGYWLSKKSENHLGMLSQAQVYATAEAVNVGDFEYTFHPLGRSHQFTSDLVGELMRSDTLNQTDKLDPVHAIAPGDPSINQTFAEMFVTYNFLSGKDFSRVIHLVNPTHLPRTKLVIEELKQARQIYGVEDVTFEVIPTTDYLSSAQRSALLNHPEQARYNQREVSADRLMGHPRLRKTVDAIPAFVKRILEDKMISDIPVPTI